MPFLIGVIKAGSTDVPVDTIRTLHTELAAVGLSVGVGEATDTRFGSDTQARVREFQKLYRLPETGDVDPATGGILSLSALVATEGDRTKVRAELTDAINKVPNSTEYNTWLARYALMARDYKLASRVKPTAFNDFFGNDLSNDVFTSDGTGNPVPQRPD